MFFLNSQQQNKTPLACVLLQLNINTMQFFNFSPEINGNHGYVTAHSSVVMQYDDDDDDS